MQRRKKRAFILKVLIYPFDIGQQQQFLSLQGASNLSGNIIGINIVAFAIFTDADRRDAQREIIEAIEAMKAALLNLERQTPPRLVAPP